MGELLHSLAACDNVDLIVLANGTSLVTELRLKSLGVANVFQHIYAVPSKFDDTGRLIVQAVESEGKGLSLCDGVSNVKRH